jgi:hypothetical protein
MLMLQRSRRQRLKQTEVVRTGNGRQILHRMNLHQTRTHHQIVTTTQKERKDTNYSGLKRRQGYSWQRVRPMEEEREAKGKAVGKFAQRTRCPTK